MAEVALRDYLDEIDNLIEHGSSDAALRHCRHILQQYPKAVEVYRMMGKALLEQEDDRAAQDVFQRVLSVDPEDFVARVGLSIVHDRNNELEPAIWHLERAFDIAPSNALIQGELRRLYARRDGESPERIPLTRDALARMYAQGDLNAEAIADLRQLLREQPNRIDLQIQMAEVLWRDEQRVEASELTQKVVNTLPYCLKANLIMGAILRDSGVNGESEEPFQRAWAVDPENAYAVRFFGGQGPLTGQTVIVDRLELQTVTDLLEAPIPVEQAEDVPEWLRGISDVETPLLPESELEHAPRLSTGLHMPDVATEIPAWLQGLTTEPGAAEAEVPDWLATLTGVAAVGAAAHAVTERESATPEEAPIKPSDEEVPDWIHQLGTTGTLTPLEPIAPIAEEEQPDWMAQLRETPPAPFSEEVPLSEDTQTPDWLAQLQASVSPVEEAASTEEPDWLAQLRASSDEVLAEPEPPAVDRGETLDSEDGKVAAGAAGLAGLVGAAIYAAHEGGEEEAAPEPTPQESSEAGPASTLSFGITEPAAEPAPAVSFGITEPATQPVVPEEMPSADDALAFLAKLAAGKEDQLRAQAQQDADVRMAEIMGRKPAEAKPVEPTREERPAAGVVAAGAAMAGAAAVAGAVAAKKEEPTTPIESAPPVSVEPPAELVVPEAMPSAEDALAFLAKLAAGKEDQLRAQAQKEADVRMAEIMGRKPAEAKPAGPTPGERPVIRLATTGAAAASLVAAATKLKNKLEEPEQPKTPAAPAAEVGPPPEVPEAMRSADDALAFLSKPVAGKEDQLRAEAQREAETRMSEIMGRKPAAETKPAPEEKPGAGLATAVAVGAAAAGLAAVRKQEPEELTAPAEVPETMPSADDALAFLARLAAGKEDQLRTQAEQEAEIRMAAIMGRSAPLESAKPIEPAEESTEWLTDLTVSDIAEPAPASELPDWLRAMQPPEETVAAEPATELPEWLRAMRPDESASSPGLSALFEEEAEEELEPVVPASELPEWLRVMQPDESAGGLTLEAMAAEIEEIEPVATPASELPKWLRSMGPDESPYETTGAESAEAEIMPPDGLAGAAVALGLGSTLGGEPSGETEPTAQDLLAELTALEQAASAPSAGPVRAEVALSHDWWAQSAEDTGEEPLIDLPEPFLSPRARAIEREKGRAAAPAAEKVQTGQLRKPQTGPLRLQTGPLASLPQTGPLDVMEPVVISPEIEALMSRVSDDRQDYTARLDLARMLWATGDRDSAYNEYVELADAGRYPKEVISDLETIVGIHDLPDWHRTLGDVYMKAGRLTQALAQYRLALNEL